MSRVDQSEVVKNDPNIRNHKLLVKSTKEEKLTTYVIKHKNLFNSNKDTFLSDVLYHIPAGIVHKEETGMGATSMELKAQRHSIIVEPIKVTASSKAHDASEPPNDKVLYIGSPTVNHPKRTTKKHIQTYLADKSIQYKKIVVVADSLYRIIDAGGASIFKNFFLLLDEADSFQMDSTYRKSMEQCMDIYKQFHRSKRAMVSATINNFSDPDLADEPKTNIRYDKEKVRKITLMQADSSEIHGVCYDEVKTMLKKYPDQKIVVAYNSVTNCYSILNKLLTNNIINADEVSFLCSKNSADRVKKYYKELESKILPSRLCFMTSAYFSGFDLTERYHLITISSIRNHVYTLSAQRIKQIAGRCRHTSGLLSETIIHDAKPLDPDKDRLYTAVKLIKAAQSQIEAFNCMHGHYKKHAVLYQNYDAISTLVLKALDAGKVSYIRRQKDTGSFKISYLTIDAVVENSHTRFKVYNHIDNLADELKKKHQVTVFKRSSTTLVDIIDPVPVDRVQLVEDMITYLRNKPAVLVVQNKLENTKLQPVEKQLLELYVKFVPYISVDSFVDALEEAAIGSTDNRKLKNLDLAATYCILPDTDSFKMNIRREFIIGDSYTPSELASCLSHAFTSSSIVNTKHISEKRSKEIVNLFFKTDRKPRKKVYIILSENPKLLVVKKTMLPVDSKKDAKQTTKSEYKMATISEILSL